MLSSALIAFAVAVKTLPPTTHGFSIINLPGSAAEGTEFCRYPMQATPDCYTSNEEKTGTIISTYKGDGTTLMVIDGEKYLFHVPDLHVTYKDCYMPLAIYLGSKDHGLNLCTHWKPKPAFAK